MGVSINYPFAIGDFMNRNRFIPSIIPLNVRKNAKFRAEVTVYDALRQQLDLRQRDWVVVWSSRWISKPKANETPRVGEADFLLAHPKYGVIVTEVKGGVIEYRNRQWFSTDSSRQSHPIDPFQQVERNAYELAFKFDQLKRWVASPRDKYARWVIFPDSVMPRGAVNPTDFATEMVTDAVGMNNIVEGLLSASKYWYGEKCTHPSALKAPGLLLEIFDEPIQFTMPLAVRARDEAQIIEQLTDSQYRVINAVSGCPRVAIAGGAGSGKTWLARKRAVQLAEEGFRVLLTCRGKPLAKYLLKITQSHGNLVICDYLSLLSTLGDKQSSVVESEYGWKLAEFTSEHPGVCFDAVFVDEGQDFSEGDWEFLECLLGREKQGIFYVFYDDNQQMHDRPTALPPNMMPLYLEDNVRTTRAIHQDIAKLYSGEKPQRPQGPLGRSVEYVNSEGKLEFCVRQVIAKLLKDERFDPRDIVVLTPGALSESRLTDLTLADARKLCESPRPEVDVMLSSIVNFKGRESAAIIVAELDRLPDNTEARRRLLYTALSRPRSHLVLIDMEQSCVGAGG